MILFYQEDAVHSLQIFPTLFLGHRLCEEPAPIENGYRIGNKFLKGRNITYGCNKGYQLRGPQVRICKENGEWTEEEPTCEGEIVLPVLSHKKKIFLLFLFQCSEGYKEKIIDCSTERQNFFCFFFQVSANPSINLIINRLQVIQTRWHCDICHFQVQCSSTQKSF